MTNPPDLRPQPVPPPLANAAAPPVPAGGSAINDPTIRPAAGNPASRVWEGFLAPFSGFAFLNRHPGLWRYAFWPVLFNLLLTAAICIATVWVFWSQASRINGWFDDTWWDWMLLIATWLGLIFGAIAGTFILYLISIQIFCAFFFGRLAVETEVALGLPRETIREISLWHEAIDAVRDVASLLLVMFVCMVLNCVPVIGTGVALAAVWYFDSFIFGRDFLDYPLSLRAMRRADKLAFCRKNRSHTLGLGASALLMSLVPVFGSIFLATSVVGAVILHRRIELSAAAACPQ